MEEFIYTTNLHHIRKMTKRVRAIQGGSSAGKSISIVAEIINTAIIDPNSTISCVTDYFPTLRLGIMRDFKNIMVATKRWNNDNWNKTTSTYTFSNGSVIEFFGVIDELKSRGARRDYLFINEANRLPWETANQLMIRTNKVIWLDWNPSSKFWFYDKLQESDIVEFITLNYKGNEGLPQSIINELEDKVKLAETSEYWKNWVKVFVWGQLGQLEGVIFDNWTTIDYLPDEAKLLGTGLDFGFSNDPAGVTNIYQWNGKLILDEVLYETDLTNKELADKLKVFGVGTIVADSAEPKSIKELQGYGLKIEPAVKGKDSINYGILKMQEQEFLVTKRSKNIITEFNNYTWAKDRQGNTLNHPIDKFNHLIDGIRYFISKRLGTRTKLKYTLV